jgi:hypothetical protein
MSYAESKKKLDAIRQKYDCKGDIIFRTAIQYIVEYGRDLLNDSSWFKNQMCSIDACHDKAEMEGKTLWVTRGFEKAILECAKELAQIEAYDFLTYIQREVWLGGGEVGEPDYQRAIEIIRSCLCDVEYHYGRYGSDRARTLDKFRELELSDEEIAYFGWEYLFDVEDEEGEEDASW